MPVYVYTERTHERSSSSSMTRSNTPSGRSLRHGGYQVLYLTTLSPQVRSLPPYVLPLVVQHSWNMSNENYSPKSKPDNGYISRKEYLESMQRLAEEEHGTFSTTPSKAWFQFQEENARKHTSSTAAPMYGERDDFQPIPIVKKAPSMVKAPQAANMPLKSAMKKTPSVKKE